MHIDQVTLVNEKRHRPGDCSRGLSHWSKPVLGQHHAWTIIITRDLCTSPNNRHILRSFIALFLHTIANLHHTWVSIIPCNCAHCSIGTASWLCTSTVACALSSSMNFLHHPWVIHNSQETSSVRWPHLLCPTHNTEPKLDVGCQHHLQTSHISLLTSNIAC